MHRYRYFVIAESSKIAIDTKIDCWDHFIAIDESMAITISAERKRYDSNLLWNCFNESSIRFCYCFITLEIKYWFAHISCISFYVYYLFRCPFVKPGSKNESINLLSFKKNTNHFTGRLMYLAEIMVELSFLVKTIAHATYINTQCVDLSITIETNDITHTWKHSKV